MKIRMCTLAPLFQVPSRRVRTWFDSNHVLTRFEWNMIRMYSFSIWPNVRPRNSKEADKKSEWPEKYSTEFWPDCYRKLEKKGKFVRGIFFFFQFFSSTARYKNYEIKKKKIYEQIFVLFFLHPNSLSKYLIKLLATQT
jgi:hypothetical protein